MALDRTVLDHVNIVYGLEPGEQGVMHSLKTLIEEEMFLSSSSGMVRTWCALGAG